MEPCIFSTLALFGCESIAEIQGGRLSLLKGESYGFWSFHLECLCPEIQVQGDKIQDWSVLGFFRFWNHKQPVVEGHGRPNHNLSFCFLAYQRMQSVK